MNSLIESIKTLKKNENGIYYSVDRSDISYPEEGNEACFQLEENSFWFQHRNEVIKTVVDRFNGDRIFFDIGGGNGFVSKKLEEHGVETVLVEPGEKGALNAKKRGLKNIICSTMEDAGFQDNSIPSVGLFDTVEHIEDDVLFLTKIHKYLTKDGLIYITVPAYKFLWSNEDNLAGHYRRYTLESMGSVLGKAGFKILYKSYFFSILPFPIFLFRSLPFRLGFARNKEIDIDKHQKEHSEQSGLIKNLVSKIWSWELKKVKKNQPIRFGGSCIVVAQAI